MSVLETLKKRANNQCELTQSTEDLIVYAIPPESDENNADKCILISQTSYDQLTGAVEVEVNNWRGLSDAMWSAVPAVQVAAYRQLNKLSSESWAQDSLDMLYLEDDVREWAEAGLSDDDNDSDIKPTLDSNGTQLQVGDNVTLIKDLQVKGAGFTAKRGTAVRGISLTDNPEHIEGRINGQHIVLVANFLKKM